MVPSHWGESVAEGVGFALVGWFQLSVAVLLLSRLTATLLRITMVANAAFVAIWVVSRTWGLPFGDHAWHPHDPGFVDLVCVGTQIALVVTAYGVLLHPQLGHGWDHRRLAIGAIVPLSIVALATAALGSPSARDHADASHGTHAHETAAGARAVSASSSAHDHADATHADAAAQDDKGLSALQNGHQHGEGEVKLDNATQAQLTAQLAQTTKLIERYPTIAAAEVAGWRRAGPFSPGLGTHYSRFSTTGQADEMIAGADGPMWPLLIFDGLAPDAPIAGFMYTSYGGRGAEPEGFVGPNDHWHYHTNVCITYRDGKIEAPLGADAKDVTPALCSKYGGQLIANTGYMVHVWTVPGYESSRGVFSEINPKLACPDGTYFNVSLQEMGFRTSTCRNVG